MICGGDSVGFLDGQIEGQEAMQRLRIPAFSESNLYDTLVDTTERMSEIEGRKAIVLLYGCGHFQQIDVSTRHGRRCRTPASDLRHRTDADDARTCRCVWPRSDSATRLPPGDNQMRTFAKETGCPSSALLR
jgi:hypothetical protein